MLNLDVRDAERGLRLCNNVFAGFGLAVSTKAKIKEKIKQVLQSKNKRKHISPTS